MRHFTATLLALGLLTSCGDKKAAPTHGSDGDSKSHDSTDEKRADKSDDGLTRASRRLACETLRRDLTLEAYVTPDKLTEKGMAAVQTLLDRYKNASFTPDGSVVPLKSRIKTRVVEVKTDADKATATAEGLQEMTFGEAQGPSSALIMHGFFGFVLRYGDERDVLPWWPPDDPDSLEFGLTNKMREVGAKNDKLVARFGFVTKKDELGLDDADLVPGRNVSLTATFAQYMPIYGLEPVDLQGGDVPIDPALRGLVVTQPAKPYTEKELRRIDEFVMRGGHGLLVVASAVNLTPGDLTMTATLDRHGLDTLVAGYGVEIQNEAVLDQGLSLQFQATGPMGMAVTAHMPSILLPVPIVAGEAGPIDTSFAPFYRLESLAFPFASPIVLHPERQPDATQRVVARSGKMATLDTRPVKSMVPVPDPVISGPASERILAVAVEGKLTSAFYGGDNLGVVVATRSPTASRILVIASSQFFANPFVVSSRPKSEPTNLGGAIDPAFARLAGGYVQNYFTSMILALRGSLDWIGADDEMAELARKLKPVVHKDATTPPPSAKSSILDMFGK